MQSELNQLRKFYVKKINGQSFYVNRLLRKKNTYHICSEYLGKCFVRGQKVLCKQFFTLKNYIMQRVPY